MKFKDTDKTVFVGRRTNGEIYGVWTTRQWEGQEELLHDDPAVVAFHTRPPRKADEPKPDTEILDPRLSKEARAATAAPAKK